MPEQDPMTRLPSREEEETEEALSEAFKLFESGESKAAAVKLKLDQNVAAGIFDSLLERKWLSVDEDRVKFTAGGEVRARNVIRCLRLSERLFADVFGLDSEQSEKAACQLEHVLSPEAADSICTLLGHPSECPHLNPIPAGACCLKGETSLASVVLPLSKVESGMRVRVVYLQLKKNPDVYRLLSLGLTPGQNLRVIQKYPAFVIEAGESQLALDEAICEHVFVRMAEPG